jgi:Tfp pilus assembly protein PilF
MGALALILSAVGCGGATDYPGSQHQNPRLQQFATEHVEKGLEYWDDLGGGNLQPENVIQEFTKAIQFDRDFAKAYYYRGILYSLYLEQHQEAIADFNKAIELAPNVGWGYHGRAGAYLMLGEHELEAADKAKACELDSELCPPYDFFND